MVEKLFKSSNSSNTHFANLVTKKKECKICMYMQMLKPPSKIKQHLLHASAL